jgi:hypothetical protein
LVKSLEHALILPNIIPRNDLSFEQGRYLFEQALASLEQQTGLGIQDPIMEPVNHTGVKGALHELYLGSR